MDDNQDGQCERVDIEGLERMNINGFTPVIFQIVPVTNLYLLLGIKQDEGGEEIVESDQAPNPRDISFMDAYRNKYYRRPQSYEEILDPSLIPS